MPYENETEQDVLARARAWRARRLGFVMRYLLATGWWGDRIRFTVSPSGDRKLTLQDFTAPINAVVNWGDGTRDALTKNAPLSHTYADEKPRTVTISGQLGGFWNKNGDRVRADGSLFVTSLDEVSSQSLVSLLGTFCGCTSLKKIPATLDAPALNDFRYAFYGCGSIEGALPAYWKAYPKISAGLAFRNCAATVASTMEGGIMRCTWLKYPLETTTLYQYATATGMWLAQECCTSGTRYSQTQVNCRASGKQTLCAQAACPWPLSTSSQATPCTNPKNTDGYCPHFYGNSACQVPAIDNVYAEAQKAGWA